MHLIGGKKLAMGVGYQVNAHRRGRYVNEVLKVPSTRFQLRIFCFVVAFTFFGVPTILDNKTKVDIDN